MKDYFLLELRKERLTLAALAAAFLVTLLLAAWGFRLQGASARLGLDAALLFWTAAGLPLSALILAGAGGAGLRSPTTRAVEDVLPLSPLRRLVAAAAACAALLLALVALVLGAAAVSPGWRAAFSEFNWSSEMLVPYMSVDALTTAYLFALAFCLSYGVGHGVAGASLAAALGGATTAALTSAFALHLMFGVRAPIAVKLVVFSLVAGAGVAATWWRLAGWVERRPRGGWKGLAVVVPGALCGAVAAALCFALTMGQALTWKELCWVVDDGAVVRSLDREVDWIGSDGSRRVLVPGDRLDFRRLTSEPFLPEFGWLAVDGRQLWVLKNAGAGKFELWTGDSGGPLTIALSFAAHWPEIRTASPLRLWDYRDGRLFAAPIVLGRPLRWRPASWEGHATWPENEYDGKTVDGVPCDFSDDWMTTTIIVRESRGPVTMTHVARALLTERPRLLRAGADALWLRAAGGGVVKVDRRSGKLLERLKLPTGEVPGEAWLPARGGIFARSSEALWFLDWDGRPRRLPL